MTGEMIVVSFDKFCRGTSFCVNLPDKMRTFLGTLSPEQTRLLWGSVRLRESGSAWYQMAAELDLTLSGTQRTLASEFWKEGYKNSHNHNHNLEDIETTDIETTDVDGDVETPDVETPIETLVDFLTEIIA